MSACQCRCHIGGPHVSCNIGPEQPGGEQSCTVTHAVALEEACILGHAEPVEREFGYACRRHYHWIDRTLGQIEELFALLDDAVVPMLSNGLNAERGGTREGSSAPGRLDAMTITDPRNRPTNAPMTPYLNDDGRGGLESNGVEQPDLPGSLASWARIVVEEMPTRDEPKGSVSESIRILRRERKWIAAQEWLDEYVTGYGGIVELHRAIARAVGDSMWPKPIGKCPNDQTPLYNTIGLDEVTCWKCRTTWTGVHLARLRLIHEREAK